MQNKKTHSTANSPKFPISELRKNAMKLFGVTTSTFDGATYGCSGEYTVEQIRDIIVKWKKKEVK